MFSSPAVARRSVTLTLSAALTPDQLDRREQRRLRIVTLFTFLGGVAVVFLFGFFVGRLTEFEAGRSGVIGAPWILVVPPLCAIVIAMLVTVRRVTQRQARAVRQADEFARNKAATLQRLVALAGCGESPG